MSLTLFLSPSFFIFLGVHCTYGCALFVRNQKLYNPVCVRVRVYGCVINKYQVKSAIHKEGNCVPSEKGTQALRVYTFVCVKEEKNYGL